MNWLKKNLPIIVISWLSLGVFIFFAGLLAYSRLIGFGFGHDPISTSSTLLHLMLAQHAYEKIPAYPERYLVKKSQRQTFFKDLQLKERKDLQMGAGLTFDHPGGKRCATVQFLNDGYVIYDFHKEGC